MPLNEKIQSLRRERGLSQEELAITLGVSRQAVSKWELGDATPDTDKVIALANYFGVTTDYLLRDIAPEAAPAQQRAPSAHKRFAPMLLCIDWCGSALGLCMMLYGRYFAANDWPRLVGLMLLILFAMLPLGSSLMIRQEDEQAGRLFLRQFWRVNIWLIMLVPLVSLGGGSIAQFIPKELLSSLWNTLPEPLWALGRLAVFAALPFVLYASICLLVTFLLRKKSK